MKRKLLAGVGLMLGVVALSGCVPPPPPAQVAAVPVAVAPPPIIVVPPPVIVMQPPAPPVWSPMRHHVVRHRTVRVVHRVYHHWTHRYYATRVHYWSPRCGSVDHPCTVEERTAPIQ
jgi:hypothetical protein